MLSAILIAILIVIHTLQSLLCKKYSDCYPGKAELASPVFTVVSGVLVVIVSFAVAGFSFSVQPLTILLGIINAGALFGYNTCIIKGSQSGPYSVLMVFSIAGGIAVPAFVARFAFGDELSILKFIAILCVFVSVYLVSHKKEESVVGGKTFIPACLGLGLCNGAYGALLDAQQRLTGTAEKEEMVAVSYMISVMISLVLMIVKHKREAIPAFKQSKQSLVYLIACSLVVATAINYLVFLLPLIDTTLLYTFDNACVMLLSVLASCVLFREKLSRVNVIGCIAMCASLVCVSIF